MLIFRGGKIICKPSVQQALCMLADRSLTKGTLSSTSWAPTLLPFLSIARPQTLPPCLPRSDGLFSALISFLPFVVPLPQERCVPPEGVDFTSFFVLNDF